MAYSNRCSECDERTVYIDNGRMVCPKGCCYHGSTISSDGTVGSQLPPRVQNNLPKKQKGKKYDAEFPVCDLLTTFEALSVLSDSTTEKQQENFKCMICGREPNSTDGNGNHYCERCSNVVIESMENASSRQPAPSHQPAPSQQPAPSPPSRHQVSTPPSWYQMSTPPSHQPAPSRQPAPSHQPAPSPPSRHQMSTPPSRYQMSTPPSRHQMSTPPPVSCTHDNIKRVDNGNYHCTECGKHMDFEYPPQRPVPTYPSNPSYQQPSLPRHQMPFPSLQHQVSTPVSVQNPGNLFSLLFNLQDSEPFLGTASLSWTEACPNHPHVRKSECQCSRLFSLD